MSEDDFPPARGLELDDEHREILTRALGRGAALAAKYARSKRELPTLQALDKVYDGWRAAPPAEREPPREVLEALAAMLGAHLAAIPGLTWIVVKDDEAADLAIYGALGEVLVYPFMYVTTRHEADQPLEAAAMVRDVQKRWKALTAALADDDDEG
jgi:hypothetical protein